MSAEEVLNGPLLPYWESTHPLVGGDKFQFESLMCMDTQHLRSCQQGRPNCCAMGQCAYAPSTWGGGAWDFVRGNLSGVQRGCVFPDLNSDSILGLMVGPKIPG